MRMTIPAVAAMMLISGAAMAEGPSSAQQSANAKYAADGADYRNSRITMPQRVGGKTPSNAGNWPAGRPT